MATTTADRKRRAYLRRIPEAKRSIARVYARQRAAWSDSDIHGRGWVNTDVRNQWQDDFHQWLMSPVLKAVWDSGIKIATGSEYKRLDVGRIDAAYNDYIANRAITLGKDLANVNAQAVNEAFVINSTTSRSKLFLDLRGSIGLHPRQIKALEKQMAIVRKNIPENKWAMWERRLTNQKRDYRANLIARTEMGNASNAAQIEGTRLKIEKGELSPATRKMWSTSGKKTVCPICERNELEGFIPMQQEFSSGHDRPLAHPNCQCALEFSSREQPKPDALPRSWSTAPALTTAVATGLGIGAARAILEKRGMARTFLLQLDRAEVDDLLTTPQFTDATVRVLMNKYGFVELPISNIKRHPIKRKPQSAVDRLPL